MKGFFVKSDNFSLLRAFKEECEKIGWKYDERFMVFSDRNVGPRFSGKITSGLYFDSSEGKPWFSLSNDYDNVYTLPQNWNLALKQAKKIFDDIGKVVEITENDIRKKFNIASEVQIKIIK